MGDAEYHAGYDDEELHRSLMAESRLQHDTLDQIIAKALREHVVLLSQRRDPWDYVDETVTDASAAVRDALLAEGRVRPGGIRDGQEYHELVIPLLVGVGCGNAKKDTPKEHA